MRLKLISCEVMYREMCAVIARSPHQIDSEFLPKALHETGTRKMRTTLQERLDVVDADRYDAVLLGYGLCGTGTAGLRAGKIPVVIPRSHDCIGLLMGGDSVYQSYINTHRGVFFRSTGWMERAREAVQMRPGMIDGSAPLSDYVARYGQDSAQYLYEQLNTYRHAYQELCFIRTGLEPSESFEQNARQEAREYGWRYATVDGSMMIFEKLANGEWNDREFLILRPGSEVVATFDERIMEAKVV